MRRDHWEWNGKRWLAPTRPPPSDRPIEEQIRYWAYYGFRVQFQTATTAQMVRPKSFSFAWASLWFIFGFGIGIFFYLFYYMGKRDEMVFLRFLRAPGAPVKGQIYYGSEDLAP